MQRDVALAKLVENKLRLHQFGVTCFSVVGSVAHEARLDTDVGVFVDFYRPVGLFEMARLREFVEETLACRVELGSFDALRPNIREQLLHEAVSTV